MNRDDITRMAREAGFANARGGLMDNGELSDYWDCWPNQLERFFHAAYAAGAAAEREACATYLERGVDLGGLAEHPAWQNYTADLLACCAAAIRSRGQQ